MTRLRHIVTAILALAALAAGAQGQPSWIESVHDFGTFKEEAGTVTCTMQVVNVGDSALVITRVKPTCGCTVAEYSRETMQPGDTGTVTIAYNPRHIPGLFEKTVFVYTNGRPRKSVLTVKGHVIGAPETIGSRYPVSCGSLHLTKSDILLGEVPRGKVVDAFVAGYNTASDTLLVTIEGMPRHLAAHVVPDSVPPGEGLIVDFYYDTTGVPLWGLNTDTLSLVATPLNPGSDGIGGMTHLEVMANVKENFENLTSQQRRDAPVVSVSADKLDFGILFPGEQAKRTLTVTNTGKRDLMLRRLFAPGGEGISLAADKQAVPSGKTATVTVTIDTASLRGTVVNTTADIITNDPYMPQTRVRIVGLVK